MHITWHSCVKTIEETLHSLTPAPSSIQVSVVSQSVTIHHSPQLSYLAIEEAVESAGFDISSAPISGPSRLSDTRTDTSCAAARRKKHLQQCSWCQKEMKVDCRTVHDNITLLTSQSISGLDDLQAKKLQSTVVSSAGLLHAADGPCKITLSVGGMTCASCSSAITRALSEIPGVTDVSVSLLGNSTTALLERKNLVDKVIETMDMIGYEADLVDVSPCSPPADAKPASYLVSLSVGGMTCVSCSSTITRLVSELEGVQSVVVSLLGNSASVVIEREELASSVVNIIEDAGYEASVVLIGPVQLVPATKSAPEDRTRSVSLRIEGMFCQ